MIQIIPEKRKRSFLDRLGTGLMGGASAGAGAYVENLLAERESENKQRMLEREYALKGNLEEQKQAAKFANQFKLMQQLGLTDDLDGRPKSETDTTSRFQEPLSEISQEGTPKTDEINVKVPNLIPQNTINKWAMVNPSVADKMQQYNNNQLSEARHQETLAEKRQREERRQFEEERGYHTQFSKEIEKEVNQLRAAIPRKEMALNLAREAIETGNLEFFSKDNLSDKTGIDAFRTAKGAQLITAGKENLLSNMSRVSSRGQNMWFEQRLNSMFPKIGQSREANLTIQEMIEGELALDKAYSELFDLASEQDEKKYGYVKKDISKRVHKSLEPYEKEIFQRTTYRMRELEEQEMGLSKLKDNITKKVPKGTPLTLANAKLFKEKFGDNALDVAKKSGYYIPTIEEYQRFRKSPQEFREELVE